MNSRISFVSSKNYFELTLIKDVHFVLHPLHGIVTLQNLVYYMLETDLITDTNRLVKGVITMLQIFVEIRLNTAYILFYSKLIGYACDMSLQATKYQLVTIGVVSRNDLAGVKKRKFFVNKTI